MGKRYHNFNEAINSGGPKEWDSTDEKDVITLRLRIVIVLAMLAMFIYALFQLVRAVEKEATKKATMAERERIYGLLSKDAKENQRHIKYLERLGRGAKQ